MGKDNGEKIMSALWDMMNKKNWLDTFQMKKWLQGYTPSELHCIDYIGKNAECNVTKLSDAFLMTRSAISKLSKKLIKKNLIESYQKPENKKEVYFRLTDLGKELYDLHEKVHIQLHERDKDILDNIGDHDFLSIMTFICQYSQHLDKEIENLGVDLKKESFDNL